MKYYITHKEFPNLYNKDEKIFDRLFKDTKLFSTLVNNIIKESKNWEKFSYSEKDGDDKMKGDIFEIFCECFFKILGSHNKIGVGNYKPEQEYDCGVDASGIGINGRPLTIQCKFRSNRELELTQRDLNQFWGQSLSRRFNVDKNDDKNMIVFTSAAGLHFFTKDKVFLNTVITIGNKQIGKIVNNNFCFWNSVRDYVKETIKKNY